MQSSFGRRGAIAGGLAAAFFARPAYATTTLKAGYAKFASGFQYFAAKDQGFFAAEGLALDDSFTPPPVTIPGILSGRLDLAMQNMLDIALINTKGGDIKVLHPGATLSAQYPYCQIVVPKGSTARTAKDLEGKRIAVPVLRSSLDIDLDNWLMAGGVNPASVSLVGVGMDGVIPAIQSKQFDAAYVIEPALTAILTQDYGISIATPSVVVAPATLATGYMASGAWIDKNPDTAKAIVRALARGTEWLLANPSEVPGLMVRNTGISEALASKMISPGPTKMVIKADIQPFLDSALKLDRLPQRVDVCSLLSKYCPSDC